MTTSFYVYILYRDTDYLVPFYVGKGTKDRMYMHERKARLGGKSHKCNIIRQIQLTGRKVIKEKIFCDTEAESVELEIAMIAFFGRLDNGTGILSNLTDGGEGISGFVHSRETRGKISKSHLGLKASIEHLESNRVARLGKKLAKEHCENIGKGNLGGKRSLETRKKMSEARIMLGLVFSAETRRRMSEAAKSRKRGPLSAETRKKIGDANRMRKRA